MKLSVSLIILLYTIYPAKSTEANNHNLALYAVVMAAIGMARCPGIDTSGAATFAASVNPKITITELSKALDNMAGSPKILDGTYDEVGMCTLIAQIMGKAERMSKGATNIK